MVDHMEEKGLADFMDTNFGDTAGRESNKKTSTANKERGASLTSKMEEASSGIRKFSQRVFDETKSALTLGLNTNEEEQNNMTINEEVQVIELAPSVFQAIRRLDNITPKKIEVSLDTEKNNKMLFKAKESEGKSGSFMFQSWDKRFIIKTMSRSEQQVMVKALPKYLNYLLANRESLIARIYGIFTIRMEDQAEIHILLMGNLWENVSIRESEFDLKGSIINREVQNYNIKKCLKDVNLKKISH